MKIEFDIYELAWIRQALHEIIMQQKAGKYTDFNKLAKKIDEALDVEE